MSASAYDPPRWREWMREWGLLVAVLLYAASVATGYIERRERRAEMRAKIQQTEHEIARLERLHAIATLQSP